MANPFNRPTDVLNVFVNGRKIDPQLYVEKAGIVEFVKPLKDIMQPIEGEKPTGVPEYWTVIEYAMSAE